jgi:hypothetical protein
VKRFAVQDTYATLKILPLNPSFEVWRSSMPDNWDLVADGTVTIAQNTTLFSAGASSLALTLTAGNWGGVQQEMHLNDPARPIAWWRGQSVVFRAKVRATLATAQAVLEVHDGTASVFHYINPSSGLFNLVETPPKTIAPTAPIVWIRVSALPPYGATVYFDEAEVLVTEPEIFQGGLFEPPTIDESLSDTYYGTREPQDVALKIALGKGTTVSDMYAQTTKGVGLRCYALDAQDDKTLVWDGIVNTVGISDTAVTLNGTPNPINILETEVPVAIVDETWPAGHGIGTGIPVDKGEPIPDVIGYVPRVKCIYVSEKLTTNEYHYVCTRGLATIPGLYRGVTGGDKDKVQVSLINPIEYTVSYTAYPGYTAVIFPVRQIDFGGQASTIYADLATLVGNEIQRNPARVMRTYLTDLGQTVVAAAFDRAETEYARLGYVVDFALTKVVQLQDLFRNLLQMLDGVLTKTSAGWTLDIDIRPTTVDYAFQEGPQVDVPTIVQISARETLPLLNETSRVVVKYLPDLLASGDDRLYLGKAIRQLSTSPHAVPLKIDLPQVRDWVTADRLADYRAKQILARSERLTITGPQIVSGRRRTLVSVTSPRRNLSNATYMIVKASRPIGGQPALDLAPWSPDPYVYEPGPVPTDLIRGTFQDFSRVPPPIITDISFPTGSDFRGTETGPAGSIKAYVTVRFVAPTTGNYAYAVVRYRPALSVIWFAASGPIAQLGTVDVKIRGLEPAISYEYSVQSFNQWGLTAGG